MSTPQPTGTTDTSALDERPGTTPDRSDGAPLVGGPGYPETSPDGVSTLRLHAGIAVMATILSLFVTAIYIGLGTTSMAIIFGVLTLACIAIWFGATARIRRARGGRR
jgi:hypothetical protein